MCYRVMPFTLAELEASLAMLRVSGRARLPRRDPSAPVPDAYPGSTIPLFVPDERGELQATALTWGFDAPQGGGKLVFNTRIETALSQARAGRGMWSGPIQSGRCLVPVRGFFERDTRSAEDRAKQVLFTLAGHGVFLLAGVQERGRLSVVTTEPNADMARVHSRMPLVLGPGESSVWLGPDFASLADRSHVRLDARPEGDGADGPAGE